MYRGHPAPSHRHHTSWLLLLPPVLHSKRLAKMISTMRERLSAKLGNNNDNAFKMRKLFKMYDKQDTGMVSSTSFRLTGGPALGNGLAARQWSIGLKSLSGCCSLLPVAISRSVQACDAEGVHTSLNKYQLTQLKLTHQQGKL